MQVSGSLVLEAIIALFIYNYTLLHVWPSTTNLLLSQYLAYCTRGHAITNTYMHGHVFILDLFAGLW